MSESHFHFSTYDLDSRKNDRSEAIAHNSAEGVWTFVYFSYSKSAKKAVGYLKVGSLDINQVQIDANHKSIFYLHFIFGGK